MKIKNAIHKKIINIKKYGFDFHAGMSYHGICDINDNLGLSSRVIKRLKTNKNFYLVYLCEHEADNISGLNRIVDRITISTVTKIVKIDEKIKNTVFKINNPIFKHAVIKGAKSLKGNKKIFVNVLSYCFGLFCEYPQQYIKQ